MSSPSTSRLRGLMAGAGYFARIQAEAWQRMPAARILAIADPVPGKAAALAAECGIPHAFTSVEEMIAAVPADFIDIATRPDTHLALTQLAARHHLHVICQKPMAPTLAESEAMCAACEAADVRLLIHENWRWQPWYREAHRLIVEGTLGTLQHLSFDWRTGDGNGPTPYPAQPYFRDMPQLLIYESLVHILDTWRFLAGELLITRCQTWRVNPLIKGEDWAEIHLRFHNGASGFIHGDRHTGTIPSPVAMGSMLLTGSRAALRISPDGFLFLMPAEADSETLLPFVPPTTGYKGDSVYATQCHLLHSLITGTTAETEGRTYLQTASLVADCYSLAGEPSV